MSHRICSRGGTPQPRRKPTRVSCRGVPPAVIRLWTVAREMGVPASLLRLATLSRERRRVVISARRRPANSAGVAAPVGSGGTADILVVGILAVLNFLGSP